MTQICKFIEERSDYTWNYLSSVFNYGLKVSELGITFDLIYQIVNFYGGSVAEVRIDQAIKENISGADILLIVKHKDGRKIPFVIQSKAMSFTGKFIDLKESSSGLDQWEKLIEYGIDVDANPIYLFYCGKPRELFINNPLWGYSCCNAHYIKHFMDSIPLPHRKTKNSPNPNELNSENAYRSPNIFFPFHLLFCNDSKAAYDLNLSFKYSLRKFQTLDQILDGIDMRRYKKIDTVNDFIAKNESFDNLVFDRRVKTPKFIVIVSLENGNQ